MSTRIKSAAVAIVIAVVALILHNTFVFNLVIGFISVVALFEVFRAIGVNEHKYQCAACYAYAALSAIMPVFYYHGWLTFINKSLYGLLYIMAMCLLYLKEHNNFKYTEFFGMIGATLIIPYSFGTILSMARLGKLGVFLIVLTLCGAWLADSGAYFAGTFFGRTKLCPEISPKKTVESLIGGVVCNGIIMLIISFVYSAFIGDEELNYIMIFIAGMLCALVGLVGDLTASVIKRQTGIKDYGNIMPGHGGIMDRFDSVLLVAPFMYYLISHGAIVSGVLF